MSHQQQALTPQKGTPMLAKDLLTTIEQQLTPSTRQKNSERSRALNQQQLSASSVQKRSLSATNTIQKQQQQQQQQQKRSSSHSMHLHLNLHSTQRDTQSTATAAQSHSKKLLQLSEIATSEFNTKGTLIDNILPATPDNAPTEIVQNKQQQAQSSQEEYLRLQCQVLEGRVRQLEGQSSALADQVQNLRRLNLEYAQQMNEMQNNRAAKVEKIILTAGFLESEQGNPQTKSFIRKLANNYKLQETQQERLRKMCNAYEQDLANYKLAVEAQVLQREELKQNSIENEEMLLRKTRELEQQRNDLSSKLQQATQNLHLKDEKIVGLIQQNSDQAIQMSAQQNKHTELLLVYQKIKEEQDNKKDFAKKKEYHLRSTCDQLENSMRKIQTEMSRNQKEKLLLDIKCRELDGVRQVLRSTHFTDIWQAKQKRHRAQKFTSTSMAEDQQLEKNSGIIFK